VIQTGLSRKIRLTTIVALAVVLSGCGLRGAEPTTMPTIVRVPEGTRVAVQTMIAATQYAVAPTSTSPVDEGETVAAATPSSAPAPASTVSPSGTATQSADQPTPTGIATAEAPQYVEHVVRRGENLARIARAYGVSVEEIILANHITNPSLIWIGQVLRIPQREASGGSIGSSTSASAAAGSAASTQVAQGSESASTPEPTVAQQASEEGEFVEHVVRSGENLVLISARYGVPLRAIIEANHLVNPSVLWAGQVLRIPIGDPDVRETPPKPEGTSSPVARLNPGTANPGFSGYIAFQVAAGGDIFVVDANGRSAARRLTSGMDPAWSPDGGMLAFVRWTVPWGIYVINADGTGERLIWQQNLVRSPTWSPDGRRLAFTRQEGGAPARSICVPGYGCFELSADPYWRLGVVSLDGGEKEDLPDDLHSFSPTWSPLGNRIVYGGERGLRATFLDEVPRFVFEDISAAFPVFSPDGARLAFMYKRHDHWDIFVINADGSGLQQLTSSSPLAEKPAHNVSPTWSPDGQHILFLSDRDGRWRPYIMAADGSGQTPFLPEVFDNFTFRYDFALERVFDWTG